MNRGNFLLALLSMMALPFINWADHLVQHKYLERESKEYLLSNCDILLFRSISIRGVSYYTGSDGKVKVVESMQGSLFVANRVALRQEYILTN